MPSPELIEEAERQLTICNACRYCEGYCAVFPAMELRRRFDEQDIAYLANLCFECRACYYACPFTPPHDYQINIPQVLAEVRLQTYAEYTPPRLLSKLFHGNGRLVALTVAACVLFVLFAAVSVQGASVVFGEPAAEGSFYRVVPYLAMTLPALALSAYWAWALIAGGVRFWRSTRGSLGELMDGGSLSKATKDAFGLEYLRGGGEGCTYPDERPSTARRWLHQALVAGILLDFASTTVAAIYHNFLGEDAPYPYLSLPVVLGTAGGVLIILAVLGLAWLKLRADPLPASRSMLGLDWAFLWLLFLTAASGLILLGLRDTSAMGTLLTVHLGIVAALYLALPYSKFAHVVHRYAALIRYRIETARQQTAV